MFACGTPGACAQSGHLSSRRDCLGGRRHWMFHPVVLRHWIPSDTPRAHSTHALNVLSHSILEGITKVCETSERGLMGVKSKPSVLPWSWCFGHLKKKYLIASSNLEEIPWHSKMFSPGSGHRCNIFTDCITTHFICCSSVRVDSGYFCFVTMLLGTYRHSFSWKKCSHFSRVHS